MTSRLSYNNGGKSVISADAETALAMQDADAWQVAIEWDGQPPNEVWRNRIRQITGITARGVRDNLTTHADGTQVGSSMPQECVFVTSSKSLARMLWFIASEGYMGVTKETRKAAKAEGRDLTAEDREMIYPTRVVISPVIGAVDSLTKTAADEANLTRVRNLLSRTGPKPRATTWTTTCYEEGRTKDEDIWAVFACPSCGGQHFRTRGGTHYSYQVDADAPMGEAWVRSRFAQGLLEFPEEDPINWKIRDSPSLKLARSFLRYNVEEEYVDRFLAMDLDAFMAPVLKVLDEAEALRFLDSLAISLINFEPERRSASRARIFNEFYKMGGRIAPFDFEEDEDEIDIMCAAHFVERGGAPVIARMLLDIERQEAEE